MLSLKEIKKDYLTGDSTIHALKGIDINFRENEFVSILGPSGCGKTTLLNIIGGLDIYTSGDLIINGVSTKKFKDCDWDNYRNHSIGFVFQNYNLIPHQTVLANVELALTLSGVSKEERKKRAIEALEKVGLGDQIKKKPNQMSGGQMQRVAVARALVNDPDILLADEPTGALDTATSIQLMDILREISKTKLIIMVTHNPELAEKYSSRIIRFRDGVMLDDSAPYSDEECKKDDEARNEVKSAEKSKAKNKKKSKKPSMSVFTALSLSLNNLMTKKARTILTSFAGSIGIIGIALILALSNGIQTYINQVQRETLSSYPITIQKEEADISSLITSMMGSEENESKYEHENDAVYSSSIIYQLINSMINVEKNTNNLNKFKKFLDGPEDPATAELIKNNISAVHYIYNIDMNVYAKDADGEYINTDFAEMFYSLYGMGTSSPYSSMSSSFSSMNIWEELLPGSKDENGKYTSYVNDMIKDQYELVYGKWPEKENEVILVMNSRNEISDITLYSLGLMSREKMMDTMSKALNGIEIEIEQMSWSYEEICDLSYKLLLNSDYYSDTDNDGIWEDISENESLLKLMIENNGIDLDIVGIIKPNPDATAHMLSGSMCYTTALTNLISERTNSSLAVKSQLDPKNENYDIFTGLPFVLGKDDILSDADKAQAIKDYLSKSDNSKKAEIYISLMSVPSDEYVKTQLEQLMKQFPDRAAIEKTIASQLAASAKVDESVIKSYLDSMSDDELKEMLTKALTEMIISSYADEVKASIIREASVLDATLLAQYSQMMASNILADTDKIGYITLNYSQNTALPAQNIYSYLLTLSSEEIDAIFDGLVNQATIDYCEQMGLITDDVINANIAKKFDAYLANVSVTEAVALYDKYMPSRTSSSTLDANLQKLGVMNVDDPTSIFIYTASFEAKDNVAEIISDYNKSCENEDDEISYTDYVGLIMSSVTTIINAISYVLIAFVAISLVVSSIMIGIITYISVLERTKEIGILRAIGASKRDVSRVFNAETLIIGFGAGAMGILITLVLCLPINAIIRALSGIENIGAILPFGGAIILILISIGLTLISGLIPSRIAAKKDPVEALRTE